MALERGTALVRKWQPRFGLGEFRIRVSECRFEGAWARSWYDLHELWGVIDLPLDDALPDALLELLVLHELAHGLLQLAATGGINEEQACNRIARLACRDFVTGLGNEHKLDTIGDAAFFDEEDKSASFDKRTWLPIVVDALPEREREVVTALYWEGASLRDVAVRMGVHHKSVERYRDAALERLSKYFAALDRQEFQNARRIIALKEPEGGAEHGVIYEMHHRCSVANSLIRTEVGTEDMDLLVFPVGNIGFGMPKGMPFAVTALDECSACGTLVGCWFVWQAGKTDHPGSIWTP